MTKPTCTVLLTLLFAVPLLADEIEQVYGIALWTVLNQKWLKPLKFETIDLAIHKYHIFIQDNTRRNDLCSR